MAGENSLSLWERAGVRVAYETAAFRRRLSQGQPAGGAGVPRRLLGPGLFDDRQRRDVAHLLGAVLRLVWRGARLRVPRRGGAVGVRRLRRRPLDRRVWRLLGICPQ